MRLGTEPPHSSTEKVTLTLAYLLDGGVTWTSAPALTSSNPIQRL